MKLSPILAAFVFMAACDYPLHAGALPLGQFGVFEGQTDVGNPEKVGGCKYDMGQQTYRVAGSGRNIWFTNDQFHFVWKKLSGDFIVNAHAKFIGQGVNKHRKAGWMVRSTLETNSAHVTAVVHGDGLTSLQFRQRANATTEEVKMTMTGAEVIQLERKGNNYTMSVAHFGENFTTSTVTNLNLGDEVYVGVFVCSHDQDVVEEAQFDNVRIIIPADEHFVPYHDYIGSYLETLDVTDGHRLIVHQVKDSLQAPNWTPDGKALIFNRNGKIYRFGLSGGEVEEINTDFADHNNNDHALSFDGKQIGLSHQSREAGGKSKVYIMPIAGGTPKLMTPVGPSYFHGWSPDGQFLLYTGERDKEFDIYRLPVTGGEEVRMTHAPGLDDGSEYSPDGKYIYFNSERSGRMQLWRMNADGTDQVQITRDEFNNWFPHVSPDGKWIAFLSFDASIRPNEHPFYKQVCLRLMPVAGGVPAVIAYVYGGQGSMNVPSWSPDSRHIAFVSNTKLP